MLSIAQVRQIIAQREKGIDNCFFYGCILESYEYRHHTRMTWEQYITYEYQAYLKIIRDFFLDNKPNSHNERIQAMREIWTEYKAFEVFRSILNLTQVPSTGAFKESNRIAGWQFLDLWEEVFGKEYPHH